MQDDKEYQISLSALYGDGAQSEAVAVRYSTCESHPLYASTCARFGLPLVSGDDDNDDYEQENHSPLSVEAEGF